MAFRLMEVRHPADDAESLRHILADFKVLDQWSMEAGDGKVTRVLLHHGKVEKLTDAILHRFGDGWKGRVNLYPVEATIPAPPEEDAPREGPRPALRVAREQLLAQVNDALHLNPVFFAMTVLSSLVAGIGLLKDNVAIIIGGMVLAPLLSPTIAMGLATTLGDAKLGRRALAAMAAAVAAALATSWALGFLLQPSAAHPEILSRTVVDNGDLLLALVAGVAGALAFTTAVSANLIGVMVAVAMMPPLVVGGMMLGAGRWAPGLTALLLVLINILGVVLAAVGTFLVQGVLPRQWWRLRQARTDALRVAATLTALLAALAVAIEVARPG